MLSSMLSSTVFMIGTQTIVGTLVLIAFLVINELIGKNEENKKFFMPVLFTLAIIFFSVVIISIFKII